MRYIMPAKAPIAPQPVLDLLNGLAFGIRRHRLSLGVSVVVAAYAAGMSRVTWHRIEKAEPSVTMGAYVSALNVIGLDITLAPKRGRSAHELVNEPIKSLINRASSEAAAIAHGAFKAPQAIPIRNYPQLRQIAWHVRDDFELTRAEARNLYEQNSRYLDVDQMPAHEIELFNALLRADAIGYAKA